MGFVFFLPQVFGSWVLVWAVTDHEKDTNLVRKLNSSRANFGPLVPNSKTIVYKENNVFR